MRVCRDCGEEYRPEIASCTDCGGTLEDRHEAEPDETGWGVEKEEPRTEPDLSGYCQIYGTDRVHALVPLAERLRERGLAFHLAEGARSSRRSSARYYLLVPASTAVEAWREVAPLLEEAGAPMPDTEPEFADGAYRRCPACGAEITGAPPECRDCGIALGPTEEMAAQVDAVPAPCARCGLLLRPGQTECPICGAA